MAFGKNFPVGHGGCPERARYICITNRPTVCTLNATIFFIYLQEIELANVLLNPVGK